MPPRRTRRPWPYRRAAITAVPSDAPSVEEVQRLALERCQKAEDESTSAAYRRLCYVYAVGDAVVLARRATAPIPPER